MPPGGGSVHVYASPGAWLTAGAHHMAAEMSQWMTDKWKAHSNIYIHCLYFPTINFLLLGFLFLSLSLLKSPLEKLEDSPRQLNRIASHLLSSFCISSIYTMAFLHCFRDLSLFGVLLPPSEIIRPQSSLPFPPLALANSHPQNTAFIHLITFY